jgi:hypothetical protein
MVCPSKPLAAVVGSRTAQTGIQNARVSPKSITFPASIIAINQLLPNSSPMTIATTSKPMEVAGAESAGWKLKTSGFR